MTETVIPETKAPPIEFNKGDLTNLLVLMTNPTSRYNTEEWDKVVAPLRQKILDMTKQKD